MALLQAIATARVFAQKAGVTKPLHKLHVNDLRRNSEFVEWLTWKAL